MSSDGRGTVTHRKRLDAARVTLAGCADWEVVLSELRQAGASPIASIKVVRELKGVSLGEAKAAVHSSKAWADRRASHEVLHADAQSAAAALRSPYESIFDVGDAVRIEKHETLARFRADWKFHDPLSDEQMTYAGRAAVVKKVGFYHGGDVIYELVDIPGVWHEPTVGEP